MIFRIWHGWSSPENANAYEHLLRTDMFPRILVLPGSRGAYLLRRADGAEVEFVTICLFDDLDAVKAFAGENYEQAVLHEDARKLLSRWNEKSVHYDAVIAPNIPAM
jgi:hypothetical protein